MSECIHRHEREECQICEDQRTIAALREQIAELKKHQQDLIGNVNDRDAEIERANIQVGSDFNEKQGLNRQIEALKAQIASARLEEAKIWSSRHIHFILWDEAEQKQTHRPEQCWNCDRIAELELEKQKAEGGRVRPE